MRLSSSWRASAGALALAGLASGCATTQARVAVEPPPPLAVPPPPPRIILPPDPTPPPAVEEAPAPTVPQRTPRPRPSTPRPDRTEPPRPAESAPVEAPKPANGNGQDATPPTAPGPTIGMQPGSGAAEGAVRQLLGRAQDDLARVDYAALSNSLKAQYDTAKRFIVLGEQALKEQNLIYAGTLADKASAIAALLLRR